MRRANRRQPNIERRPMGKTCFLVAKADRKGSRVRVRMLGWEIGKNDLVN